MNCIRKYINMHICGCFAGTKDGVDLKILNLVKYFTPFAGNMLIQWLKVVSGSDH